MMYFLAGNTGYYRRQFGRDNERVTTKSEKSPVLMFTDHIHQSEGFVKECLICANMPVG